MKLSLLSIFLPDEALPLIMMGGGLAYMVGAKKLAISMFVFVAASVILPILLVPLIALIPAWVLWILVIYLIFLLPFMAVSMFGSLVSPAIGKGASREMTGNLAADIVRIMCRTAFGATAMAFRQLMRIFR